MTAAFASPVTGLTATPSGLTSPEWSTQFWLTQEPFIAPHEEHRRSRHTTRVRIIADDATWRIHFECDHLATDGSGTPLPAGDSPLRAVGDPDLWSVEFVQLQMPVGTEGGCIHFTVSRAGQMISERHDKVRDPIAGWSAQTHESATGWGGQIRLPRQEVPDGWKLRLARWAPDEGITRWPTPYGTWWHVDVRDFLDVAVASRPATHLDEDVAAFMARREAGLFEACGTPVGLTPFPDFLTSRERLEAARQFLNVPLQLEGDFVRHLVERVRERPWLAFGSLPEPNTELVRGLMENQVHYENVPLDLGPRPDWDSDHGNHFLMVHATRFDFLADLVAAFQHSADECYARQAVAFIRSWLEGCDVRDSLMPMRYAMRWRTGIVVSHRLVCMVRTLFSLVPTGLVPEALLFKLYAAVREAAEILAPSMARLYAKNHSVIIGDHMVQLSVLCPELKDASAIRDSYYEHLRRALPAQFLPDGTQAELSTSYLLVCYQRLTEATSLSERDGVPIPADITDWRRRILGTAAKYLLPNGQIAAFNDGHMGGTVDAIGQEDNSLLSLILNDGPSLGMEGALAVASGGRQCSPSPQISDALPFAGHYILRDGLTEDSMAVAFDAGPFGIAHAHEDALSLMLVRYGKPLLIDIGSGAYDSAVPMREYSVSTRSHSTICVDGKGQASGRFPQFWKRTTPWQGHHYFRTRVQFAHGEYSLGYGENGSIPVQHQRAVLFVDGGYVLLIDYLLGAGTHAIESHFAVAPLAHELTVRGLRTMSGDGDLDIALLYPQTAEVTVAQGQLEPFAGWMPAGMYGNVPHPRLTFNLTCPLPCCLLTLLSPYRDLAEIPRVRIEETAENIHLQIQRAGVTSHIACSRTPLDLTYRQEGTYLAVRRGEGEGLTFRSEPNEK